jgi:glyoxylase-like metal-dependent hydrolase (beta-lactamase superfamily II)/8-oxo-dGTP pyrophosphatase MutT (NUDIX family)
MPRRSEDNSKPPWRMPEATPGATAEARPAATVVLLRPGATGLEALLTQRPSSMAFAADMHVFPGGRVDPADADLFLAARSVLSPAEAAVALGGDLTPEIALAAHLAAIRELFEEAGVLLADTGASAWQIAAGRSALLRGDATLASLAAELDLRLRTDLLVPLSRWVTPPVLPRRFDARFFAAVLPVEAEPTFEGGEVVTHAWLRPTDALAAMADGRLAMWLPTSTTLQQLEYVRSIEEIRARLAPGRLGDIEVDTMSPEATRIIMPAGGGVAGQPVCAYLVGRHRFVLVDPGDPTGPALDRAIEIAATRGGDIEAVALTHADPDHAAGAEAIAEQLDIPVLAGPGAGRPLPYPVSDLGDVAILEAGDVALRAVHTPGPRPDHMAFIVGDGTMVLAGDLEGVRGARSIPGPPDPAAWASSVERLRALAPGARWLGGHPSPSELV